MHRLGQASSIALASWRVLAREPEVVALRRLAALAVGAVAVLLGSGVALWLVVVVAASAAAGAVVLASRARRLVGWAVAAAVALAGIAVGAREPVTLAAAVVLAGWANGIG